MTTKRGHGGRRPGAGAKPGTGGGKRAGAGRPIQTIKLTKEAARQLHALARQAGKTPVEIVEAMIVAAASTLSHAWPPVSST